MKIIAPNKNYTGVSASVTFANGVGNTDNPHLIRWFHEHGYTVEETQELNAVPDPKKQPDNPDEKPESGTVPDQAEKDKGTAESKSSDKRKNGRGRKAAKKPEDEKQPDNPEEKQEPDEVSDPQEKPEPDAMPDPEGEQ